MSDQFITEHGHAIPLIPTYYRRNRYYAEYAISKWAAKRPYDVDNQAPSVLPMVMAAKDWVLFSSLVYFLERHELLKQWRSGIDLGGGEGTVIRLFKAAEFVKAATNLDIVDFNEVAGDGYFIKFLQQIALPGWDNQFQHPVTSSINWAKRHLDLLPGSPTLTGLVTQFPAPPRLDSSLVMGAEDTTGSYDLVIANALLEFVDLDVVLPKIRQMLEPGGLFVGSLNMSWCPVIPSGVLGDFPYLFQRLSLRDATRYFSEHHSEQLESWSGRYNWFHAGKYRPTLSDWFGLFKRHDFRVVAFERVSPKTHVRYEHTPARLLKEPWFDPDDVLHDARHINPTVTTDDLCTTVLRIAMT